MQSTNEKIIQLLNELVQKGYTPLQAEDMAMSKILLEEFNDRKNDYLWEKASKANTIV